ncbi:MBOAT family O-acyltransferase [Aquabacter spiritensis]|uniref:Probable alginate O-acetylase AlgI n=1 Tax=Aquabacter spiritensis TaxID=933073 RepID=A0A4R3M8U6_9HYPH|nr:MBOAT family O-acyltransferase [Aquabacter spiritensis]TCT07785.1 D-alanyl-lipoteichoic acid acyltransferase DltB (MBOAT superfamily) [Aquabacter spiritensis]
MVFSSVTFLYYFLPAFLLAYFAVRGTRARNIVLLAFSLVFYGWGGLSNLIVLGVSMAGNYAAALAIGARPAGRRLGPLWIAVGLNLAGLVFFKYIGFLAANLNLLLPDAWALPVLHVELPLGISFFTFHAISYLIDIYRGRARANGRFEEIAVYITMFPQLVAGPIVRYSTIATRIRDRRTTAGRVSAGLRIFVIGLSWKVLIADEVAPIAALVFDGGTALSFSAAWLGLLAYALQIYFDFGGYSNMAIGLALAMGLNFPRNFRLPYGARSITDFWRRWHMSLSSWFRDYVYIPLGGNRRGHLHTAINLWTVFLLCGIWHGASWTFVIWGAHHGLFLVLERTRFGAALARAPRVLRHAYVMLVFLSGWVWFRAPTLPDALDLFSALVGLNGFAALSPALVGALQPVTIAMMILGWPLAIWGLPTPPPGPVPAKLRRLLFAVCDTAVMLAIFVLSVITVGAANYSPFLYFQF